MWEQLWSRISSVGTFNVLENLIMEFPGNIGGKDRCLLFYLVNKKGRRYCSKRKYRVSRKVMRSQNIGGGGGTFGTHDLAGALRIRPLVVGCRTRVADGSDISKIPQRQPETRPGPRTGSQVQVRTRRRVSGRTQERWGGGAEGVQDASAKRKGRGQDRSKQAQM